MNDPNEQLFIQLVGYQGDAILIASALLFLIYGKRIYRYLKP